MSPVAEPIIRRLDAVRQQWWLFSLMTSIALVSAGSLGLLFLCMTLDALLMLPQPAMAAMMLVWLIFTVAGIVFVLRGAVGLRSLEATARRIEAELPELGGNLINVVQLAFDTKNVNRSSWRRLLPTRLQSSVM